MPTINVAFANVPDVVPARPLGGALAAIINVLERGARTHPTGGWGNYPASYHITRARRHLVLLECGENSEQHLAHAATRVLMTLELMAPR